MWDKFIKSSIILRGAHPHFINRTNTSKIPMAQDLSYEAPDMPFLITTRTMNSRLWFVQNRQFTRAVLSYLAKYQNKYGVIIYAFILMGNHYHLIAQFPNGNKSAFIQAFNAMIARLAASHIPTFEGGKLWGRRARPQGLPNKEDVENYFFYSALNPVKTGLIRNIKQYPIYNSFHDAINNEELQFQVVDREAYNSRKRFNKNLTEEDFTETYTLKFTRLPGYEQLTQKEYIIEMEEKLHQKTEAIAEKRAKEGKGFLGLNRLHSTRPGARPKQTKTSTRYTKRPLFLTSCLETLNLCKEWYFSMLEKYKLASARYRAGELEVEFPPGTYRPPLHTGNFAVVTVS